MNGLVFAFPMKHVAPRRPGREHDLQVRGRSTGANGLALVVDDPDAMPTRTASS